MGFWVSPHLAPTTHTQHASALMVAGWKLPQLFRVPLPPAPHSACSFSHLKFNVGGLIIFPLKQCVKHNKIVRKSVKPCECTPWLEKREHFTHAVETRLPISNRNLLSSRGSHYSEWDVGHSMFSETLQHVWIQEQCKTLFTFMFSIHINAMDTMRFYMQFEFFAPCIYHCKICPIWYVKLYFFYFSFCIVFKFVFNSNNTIHCK